MVGKLIVVVVAVVSMAIINLTVETMLQLVLAVNLAELAMVVEHRGRISTLETIQDVEHDE
jgi:hypothetical protein